MLGNESMFPNFHLQQALGTTSAEFPSLHVPKIVDNFLALNRGRSQLLFDSFIRGYFPIRHAKYLFRKRSKFRARSNSNMKNIVSNFLSFPVSYLQYDCFPCTDFLCSYFALLLSRFLLKIAMFCFQYELISGHTGLSG